MGTQHSRLRFYFSYIRQLPRVAGDEKLLLAQRAQQALNSMQALFEDPGYCSA